MKENNKQNSFKDEKRKYKLDSQKNVETMAHTPKCFAISR